jgi:hypothetical protein
MTHDVENVKGKNFLKVRRTFNLKKDISAGVSVDLHVSFLKGAKENDGKNTKKVLKRAERFFYNSRNPNRCQNDKMWKNVGILGM